MIPSKNSRYVSMLNVILSESGSRLSSMDVISSKNEHRLLLVRRHWSKIVDSCRHFGKNSQYLSLQDVILSKNSHQMLLSDVILSK